jgi:membrane-associated phospholipid phosphatase
MHAQRAIVPDLAGSRSLPGLFVLVLALGCTPHATAQPSATAQPQAATLCTAEHTDRAGASLDVRGLAAVYCTASPVVQTTLRAAHATSYPAFYLGVPAAWAGAWIARGTDDFSDAYRLTVTQFVAYGAVTGLKRAIRRPRPYESVPLTSRSERYQRGVAEGARASMPSGHAGLSVALATSWSLSHPQWYVVAPSALWASAVTVSRLYLGVHYPSDVLAGALLGAGIATAAHLLRDAITPDVLQPDDPAQPVPQGPAVRIRLRL